METSKCKTSEHSKLTLLGQTLKLKSAVTILMKLSVRHDYISKSEEFAYAHV